MKSRISCGIWWRCSTKLEAHSQRESEVSRARCGETLKLPDSYVRILRIEGSHETLSAHARADHQDH
jgi:hypothetical protein